MPIGKNAIKRVTNNGYSSVKSEAPDMENSAPVVENKVAEKKEAPKKPAPKTAAKVATKTAPKTSAKAPAKTTAKKAQAKPAPKKSMETEPTLAPVNTAAKVVGRECEYYGVGDELPIYLL